MKAHRSGRLGGSPRAGQRGGEAGGRPGWAAAMVCLSLVAQPWGSRVEAQSVRQDFPIANSSVTMTVRSGNTLYIAGNFTHVGPWTGGGVPIDAASGAPLSGFPKVVGTVNAAVPDGSGGWYIGGLFTEVGGAPRSNLAHILPDNSLAAWNPETNGAILTLVLSGSIVYAGGSFNTISGQPRCGIVALDAATGNVSDWHPNLCGGPVRALALSGSTLYAGGDFSFSIPGQIQMSYSLAALDVTTGLARNWNPAPTGFVHALAVSGSTIYAGGYFFTIGGGTRNNLAALDSSTGLATNWDPHPNGNVEALAVSGTTVYAVGSFGNIGGQTRSFVAALDRATGLATSWDANAGGGEFPYVTSLAVSGTTVYVGGHFTHIGGRSRNNVAALDGASAVATDWDPRTNQAVYALARSGTTVYVAGFFTSVGGAVRNHLAALDVTTGQPTAWDPNVAGDLSSSVSAMAVSGATVYVGGYFTHMGGQPRNSVAALDAATGLATDWNPDADNFVSDLAVSGSTVYVAGGFGRIGGEERASIAALDATTGLATSWNPNANGPVQALSVSQATVYVGGGFTTIGGQARNSIAELDVATGLATAWNPDAREGSSFTFVNALAVSETTVYAGGSFTLIGSQPRNALAALDRETGLATSWDPNPAGLMPGNYPSIEVVQAVGPTVYVGGWFASIGGQARNSLAALDATTGIAKDWNPNPVPASPYLPNVYALEVSGSRVYVGGEFASIGGLPQSNLADVSADSPTPTLLSLVRTEAEPDRVRLTWFTDAEPSLTVRVYRREGESDWRAVGEVSADGNGWIVFEDVHVTPGVRYGYRLGVPQAATQVFLGETWVDVPRAAPLALTGQRPNPSAGALAVALSLPDASPARLELFDLAGRMILAREVGALGAGSHVVGLEQGRSLAPGIYLLRLVHGGRSLTARAVVMR